TIVRRAMKLYIENFDPDKSYFLASEVNPYLNMSDAKVKEVLLRLEKKDFSDFLHLNELAQKAIIRSQGLRVMIAKQLVNQAPSGEAEPTALNGYAKTEKELIERQKSRMARFYLFHEARTQLDTTLRKQKVFALFEKK